MGLQSQVLEKCYRLDADVAHEFLSCRQFLNGKAPTDNLALTFEVLNRAVPYALSRSPILSGIVDVANGKRHTATKVDLHITAENWEMIQNFLRAIRLKLDEGDVIECCLKFYSQEIKLKRCLP
jgi:hypothetical protein